MMLLLSFVEVETIDDPRNGNCCCW